MDLLQKQKKTNNPLKDRMWHNVESKIKRGS